MNGVMDRPLMNPIALFRAADTVLLPALDRSVSIDGNDVWQVALLAIDEIDQAQYLRPYRRDPAWLARALARQHEAVARLNAALPIYPISFGTLVPDIQALLSAADRRELALRHYFEFITGAFEWSLDVYGEATVAANFGNLNYNRGSARNSGPVLAAPHNRWAEQRASASRMLTESTHSWVRWRRAGPTPNLIHDSRGRQRLLAETLLVARQHEEALRQALSAAADNFAAQGMSVILSGPRPPYTFRPALNEMRVDE